MTRPATTENSYEKDFYAWTMKNAELLREGKLAEIDIEHIAEELESMGKSDKRELISRCTVLLMHLLKWRYQPDLRGNSWRKTIKEQRRAIAQLLGDSPSLKPHLTGTLDQEYNTARDDAIDETGLPGNIFPESCPFTLEDILNPDFWPN